MALLKSVSSIPIIITACFTINILFCHIWRYLPLWICIFTCVGVNKPVQRLQWSQEQQQQLSTLFCRVSGGEYTCSLIWQYVLKDIFSNPSVFLIIFSFHWAQLSLLGHCRYSCACSIVLPVQNILDSVLLRGDLFKPDEAQLLLSTFSFPFQHSLAWGCQTIGSR